MPTTTTPLTRELTFPNSRLSKKCGTTTTSRSPTPPKTASSAPLSTGPSLRLRGAGFTRTATKSTGSSPLMNSVGVASPGSWYRHSSMRAGMRSCTCTQPCSSSVSTRHSVLSLYPRTSCPKMIRERFLFCFGEMAGCNVCPMRREATP